jgi:hypothetical protein
LLGDQTSQVEPWAGATSLYARRLSDTEFLFTYFAARGVTQGQNVVLGVSTSSQTAVYKLSFSALATLAEPDTALEVLCRIYQLMSAMNVHCIVAAGAELEIDPAVQTVENVVRSTREVDSLVSFVCCESKDARDLRGFVSLGDRCGGAAFRREDRPA